jgi:hypothetical protein
MNKDEEFLCLIRKFTRECSFDFNEVASRLRSHYIHNEFGGYSNITAEQCRECFAHDFHASPSSALSSSDVLQNSVASDDIFSIQKRNEEMLSQSYDRVFQRVKNTLGISTSGVCLDSNDEVYMAVERFAEEKRVLKEKKELAERQKAEWQQLRVERERLKMRFAEGSVDSDGLNPVICDSIDPGTFENVERGVFLSSLFVCLDVDEESTSPNFRIDDMFSSPEFEAILADVERSLESCADDKSGMQVIYCCDSAFIDLNSTQLKTQNSLKF